VEDLVQEVFARALVHVEGFRGDAAFLTWAVSIGLRIAVDHARRESVRRRVTPATDFTAAGAGEPVRLASAADRGDVAERPCPAAAAALDAVEQADDHRRAREALEALPAPMRVAVTLRVVEDLDYGEVAARLGVPLPRVRQWVCRGLRRLRAALDPAASDGIGDAAIPPRDRGEGLSPVEPARPLAGRRGAR
jgi:RNA polymerase sigma-70 factor (ECF subfamily)